MRTILSLNQNWQFALQRPGMEKEGLLFTQVTLPHDWMISSPFDRNMKQGEAQGFFDRWGTGWYRRALHLEKKPETVYRLRFDGVYENSRVTVNGTYVGGRKYGYSMFTLDVTEALADGENEILVEVDNTTAPVDRWYTGAGIYRSVYLECLPERHLEREEVRVETRLETGLKNGAEEKAARQAALLTVNPGCEGRVRALLRETRGNAGAEDAGEKTERTPGAAALPPVLAQAEGEGVLTLCVPDVQAWSERNPKLYELTLQLLSEDAAGGEGEQGESDTPGVTDELTIPVGFRSVEVTADRGLFINGESVKLKGVCVHQDISCFGTAVTKELWRERLLSLKEIGCNAIRLAHHLYLSEMLVLCDELGFYVYEEAFDKWTGGAYGRFYETEWEKDLSCMVKRDRNHPCILFWGVGNEVENQSYPSMLKRLEKHVQTVKALDSTRPVSLAMNPHFAYPTEEVDMSQVEDIQQFVDEMKTGEIFDVDDRIRQIQKIAEKVDFLSCNYQEQWYERIHELIPDKAILGTETYLFFRGEGPRFQNFSEECPWMDVVEKDYCIGGFIWTGIDYWGESMGWPAKGWSGALFAADMEKRPAAWQYQSYWTEEPMVHFAVLDGSLPDEGVKEHWNSPAYATHWEFPWLQRAVLPYRIATNCERVRIILNEGRFAEDGKTSLEKEYSLRPVKEYPNGLVKGYLPWMPGTVTVIGMNGGKEVCRQVVETPGIAVRLAFEQEEQEITLPRADTDREENQPQPYRMLCKVRALDAEGCPVFRESAKVTFVVEGPARLIGVDNGDIKGAEALDGDSIHLYRGRADAGLLITGCGRVKLTAYAAGMLPAQCVIAVL